MKRFTVILLITFTGTVLSASLSSRSEWWVIRKDTLEKRLTEEIKKSHPREDVLTLLRTDINDAKKMLTLIKNTGANNQSENPVAITVKEIEATVKTIAVPLFSSAYLSLLTEYIGQKDNLPMAKNNIRKLLVRFSQKNNRIFTAHEMDYIVESYISPEEWKTLVPELIAGSFILSRDYALSETINHINSSMVTLAEKKNMTMDKRILKQAIITKTKEELSKPVLLSRISGYVESMEDSFTWHKLSTRLLQDMRNHAGLQQFTSKKNISLIEYLKSHGSFYLLDSKIFQHLREEITEHPVTGKLPSKKSKKPSLTMPRELPVGSLITEIDTLRKKQLQRIHYGSLDRPLSYLPQGKALINRVTRPVNQQYIAGQNRINSSGDIFSNSHEFTANYLHFQKQRKLLLNYLNKSIEAASLYHQYSTVDSSSIINKSSYSLKRSSKYMDFIKSLYEKSVPCSHFNIPLFHKGFFVTTSRLPATLISLTDSYILSRPERASITTSQMVAFKETKRYAAHNYTNAKLFIQQMYGTYRRNIYTSRGTARKVSKKMHTLVAESEIDLLLDSAKRYAQLYSRTHSDELFLAKYKLLFQKQSKDARKGHLTTELRQILRAGSLLGMVDREEYTRMKYHLSLRREIKSEIFSQIKRIGYLLKYYGTLHIPVEKNYYRDEIGKIRGIFKPDPTVKIYTWHVNSRNIEAIDKKASDYIRKLLAYSLKSKLNTADMKINYHRHLIINKQKVTLSLPKGWRVLTKIEKKVSGNTIITFSNLNDTNQVSLLFTKKSSSLKDAAHSWLKKNHSALIKTRWGKAGKTQYYWALAKKKRSYYIESYTIQKKNYSIIVHSIAPAHQLKYNKAVLKLITSSLSM